VFVYEKSDRYFAENLLEVQRNPYLTWMRNMESGGCTTCASSILQAENGSFAGMNAYCDGQETNGIC
jgi:hypothetical protein